MNKKTLEISIALGSILLFIFLVAVSKAVLGSYAGFGYVASLLIFLTIMGLAGLKLGEIPDN